MTTPSATSVEIDFKHYRLGASLGEGGFGQVFEAWDSKLCRDVAVKRLKQVPQGGSASLIKEARMAASVQHAAFVQIYAIEDDNDSQSIVMELVRGQTLKKLLANGPLDVPAALDIVCQIAQAMAKAHALGLVHGDLKPSNIMRDNDGIVRILDFGLATHADVAATTTMSVIDPQGTIAYMATERLNGGANTPRTDVYALGVILYELLTGARPFAALQGLPLAAALVQSTSAQWDFPATLPSFLRGLIEAMTARDPAKRLADMPAVLAALNAPSGTLPNLSHFTALTQASPATSGLQLASPPGLFGRLRLSRKAALISVPVCATLLFGAWQLAHLLPVEPASYLPFSSSREIQRGLDALRVFDRPGSLDTAEKSFTTLLVREPGNATASAGLSLCYSLRYASDGQDAVWLQRAAASAQQAMALNEQLALSHIAKAWVLMNTGKADLALQSAERALVLDPNSFFALFGKVAALNQSGRFQELWDATQLGLQRFPDAYEFSNEQGIAYRKQEKLQLAEQAFKRSITQQPDAVIAYANLSSMLLKQNRRAEALQVLQQGLQVRPSANLYDVLGNVLFQGGDYVGAAEAFTKAVSPASGNPGHYLYWANLGDALRWLPGRADDAARAYGRAQHLLGARLAYAPNDAKLISRRGLYAARSADRVTSLAMGARAIALAPTNADVYFRAGMAQELLGNRQEALTAIATARRLGYPIHLIESEPDLLALRRDIRYSQP